jgi:hypothetical protein
MNLLSISKLIQNPHSELVILAVVPFINFAPISLNLCLYSYIYVERKDQLL